jgi:glycosyltransferase involved in cell wall biosynthesis
VKLLYHHRTQAEDGQAVHIRALIRAFEAAGHEVREVGLVKRANEPGAKNDSAWSWIGRAPRFARELMEYGYNTVARHNILKAAVDFEPDFIYERYAFGNAGGVLAARKLRVPLVLEVNSPMVEELERTRGLTFRRLARRVERFVFTEADRVCVVTEVLKSMLVELGVDPARVAVTPNGVDLDAYAYPDRAAARSEALRLLGLPLEGDALVLGFVGYYRAWHRLDVILRALTLPSLARCSLALIGEGPARAELEQAAESLGVRERLHFCGTRRHDEIPALLPAFDVALIPAINPYASPLKLHEYMAASLPVVAPDQPNQREVLTPDEDALLVATGDVDAMGAALTRLATEPELRERLGVRGRRTIEERDLTWNGNVKRVLAALDGVR